MRVLCAEARAAAEDLEAPVAGTPARYPGMRTRVRTLEELGERIGVPARGEADRGREPEDLRLEREIKERRERLAELRRRELERELDRNTER